MATHLSLGVAVTSVEARSAAWNLGVRPGDRIVRVGARAVEDALAVTFALSSAEKDVPVGLVGDSGPREILLGSPDDFLRDIRLEALRPGSCVNDCLYCFCKQNPPGARRGLFFRDEDFRLSFLNGSYLTLSALTDDALHRIIHDRLHPLYVTVPATDERLRTTMLGAHAARPLLPTLRELTSAGIVVHAQIVVCPGLNDGAALERTLGDLADLRPGVASVALVPVGVTRYTPDPRIRRPSVPELQRLLRLAAVWRDASSGEAAWVQASDEVYVSTGTPLPPWREYGEAPQLSSGVGMVRRFLDDANRVARRKAPRWWGHHRIAFVTGTLFAPVLGRVVTRLAERWGRPAVLVPVENEYFGRSVTVAGLLGGSQIARGVHGLGADAVVLSEDVFAAETTLFIDDVERAAVEAAAGAPVVAGGLLSEAIEAVGRALG